MGSILLLVKFFVPLPSTGASIPSSSTAPAHTEVPTSGIQPYRAEGLADPAHGVPQGIGVHHDKLECTMTSWTAS